MGLKGRKGSHPPPPGSTKSKVKSCEAQISQVEEHRTSQGENKVRKVRTEKTAVSRNFISIEKLWQFLI
jgi:hypothetical protein